MQRDPEVARAEARAEAQRRKALLERYQSGLNTGASAKKSKAKKGPRQLPKGAVKTLGLTRQQEREIKAEEAAKKTRFLDGEVVTRTGKKTVDVAKKEDPDFVAATSVNLAYKSSKGRRNKGR